MAAREAIHQIVQRAYALCAQLMPVKACWLYGSYARGDHDDESDVDILMSIDLPEEKLKQYRRAVAAINSQLSLDYDVTVSITIKAAENIAKYSSFVPYYQNVLREGKIYAGGR